KLVTPGRPVDPVADGDEANPRPLQRLPTLRRREPVLAREPILPGNDNPRRLPPLTRLDRLPKLALPPRLRTRDAPLDDLGRQLNLLALGPGPDRRPLLVERDRHLLLARLPQVRDQKLRCHAAAILAENQA